MKRKACLLCLCWMMAWSCAACGAGKPTAPAPSPTAEAAREFVLPEDIRVNAQGVPELKVYVTEEKEIREMDLETYLLGVVAGEMKNDWPLEALKAQAILARTFVVKFITEKQSRYAGADISTDIEEAQAYDAAGINDRVRQAVTDTRGMILCYGGEPIYAWFHAHAGGRTADAAEGLSYQHPAPYTQSVDSPDSDQAPEEDASWQAEFTAQQVIAAAADAGVKLGDTVESVSLGEKGPSGRTKTLRINGKDVPANEFRIAIGSAEMKSTLLESAAYADGVLTLRGRGYGHGVGLSQWGAYALAEQGQNAKEIINMYFHNVENVQIWQ